MEMKKLSYMLEIDILRNSSPRFLGVLRGAFYGFVSPKRHPDALLAKTMPRALILMQLVAYSVNTKCCKNLRSMLF